MKIHVIIELADGKPSLEKFHTSYRDALVELLVIADQAGGDFAPLTVLEIHEDRDGPDDPRPTVGDALRGAVDPLTGRPTSIPDHPEWN